MDLDQCQVCGVRIKIAIFRGTGHCCDLHRKELEARKAREARQDTAVASESEA